MARFVRQSLRSLFLFSGTYYVQQREQRSHDMSGRGRAGHARRHAALQSLAKLAAVKQKSRRNTMNPNPSLARAQLCLPFCCRLAGLRARISSITDRFADKAEEVVDARRAAMLRDLGFLAGKTRL